MKTKGWVILLLFGGHCGLWAQSTENFRPPSDTPGSGSLSPPSGSQTNGPSLDLSRPIESDQETESTIVADSANRSWQTYDISGYTSSVKSVPNPEKNILDWILRETGTDTWFGESVGVLSVGRHRVRCYHDAETQRKVRSVIDRFLKTRQKDEVFGLQILTLGSPNWRAKTLPLLTPIETQTPGIQGWITTKENAAQFYHELRKRSDFNQPISPTLIAESGQPKKIVRQQPLNYFRSITIDRRQFPPFRVETGQINEGYVVQFSSLRSLDGKRMDAEIFCAVNQVDQFKHVNIEVPAPNGAFQKHPVSVPQMSSWRLKERFQWPADRVLLISVGVVASPDRKVRPNASLQDVFEPGKKRAEVLLLVDCKGMFDRGQAPQSAYRLVPIRNRR